MARSLKVRAEYLPQLRQALKRREYATQQLLAEELGLARSTVSNFFRGKPVDNLNFFEICRKLAVDYQIIADWQEEDMPEPSLEETNPETDTLVYVERPPLEQNCYEALERPGALLRIESPKGMGKTLLLERILSVFTRKNYQIVSLSFLEASQGILSNLESLVKWFAQVVSKQLGYTELFKKHWEDGLGSYSCTSYFEDYLLPTLRNPLILALDNVDHLFAHESVDELFSLFRVWHESAIRDKNWQKLRLIMAHSTEEYVPMNINCSPFFNIGIAVKLNDFTLEQVLELAQKYDPNLKPEDIEIITQMVGGHPSLVQKAIYALKCQNLTLEDFARTSATEEGIYRDHLLGHWLNLKDNPELYKEMKKVIDSATPVDLGTLNFKLHSLGLVEFQKNAIKPRYQLYTDYLRDRFSHD
jgi:serine/threonine-protein kinase